MGEAEMVTGAEVTVRVAMEGEETVAVETVVEETVAEDSAVGLVVGWVGVKAAAAAVASVEATLDLAMVAVAMVAEVMVAVEMAVVETEAVVTAVAVMAAAVMAVAAMAVAVTAALAVEKEEAMGRSAVRSRSGRLGRSFDSFLGIAPDWACMEVA